MRAIDSRFYNSPEWHRCKDTYLESVNHLCERCLAKGIYEPAKIVHHKIPLTDQNVNDLSISLSWDNLQALCRQCHAEVHDDMYAERTGRRYRINNNGQVVIRDNAE